MNILDELSVLCKCFEKKTKQIIDETSKEDLSEITLTIKEEMLSMGARLFELWFNRKIGSGYSGPVFTPPTSDSTKPKYRYKGLVEKNYTCCLGNVVLKRAYYFDSNKKQGIFPIEISYPCFKDKFLPDVKEMACLVSSIDPYNISCMLLKKIGNIFISASSLEEITRNIGAKLVNEEDRDCQQTTGNHTKKCNNGDTEQVIAISADGAMVNTKDGWKEVKSGAVYEIKEGDDGEPHAIKKSYVSRIENCESFGRRIFNEAIRREYTKAKTVVCIGDGARWIWDQFNLNFSGSVEIIDWYHATEHLWKITDLLFKGKGTDSAKEWQKQQEDKLFNCKVSEIVKNLKKKLTSIKTGSEFYKKLKAEIGYFDGNEKRMQYRAFKEKGLPIGSGIIEGACKNLVQIRMKRAGMRWTKRGAHAVLQIRCLLLSNRWNQVKQHLKWVS